MTHLPFVAASYALGILIPCGYGVSAWLRLKTSARKLAAVDRRQRA